MDWRLTDAEIYWYNFAREARMPAVLEASRTLQSAAGITDGKKVLHDSLFTPWNLQMPEPPEEEVKRMFAELKRKLNIPDDPTTASNARDAGGNERPEVRDLERVKQSELPRAQSGPRMPMSGQQHARSVDIPKIVVDFADDLAVKSPSKPRDLPRKKILRPIGSPLPPASPPPNWLPNARDPTSVPIYWSHQLSKWLNRWLAQPTTASSQISLHQIDLDASYSQFETETMSSRDDGPMKLIQMTIRPPPESEAGSLQPLDWVILQVDFFEECEDEDEPFFPLLANQEPYWLLAFPLESITDVKVEIQKLTRQSTSLLTPNPNSTNLLTQERESKQGQKDVKTFHLTSLVLGTKGRIPLMQGRGVSKRIGREFMKLCPEGKAVLRIRSRAPLPFA